jgi:N-acetylglucosamine-6-sulfatase
MVLRSVGLSGRSNPACLLTRQAAGSTDPSGDSPRLPADEPFANIAPDRDWGVGWVAVAWRARFALIALLLLFAGCAWIERASLSGSGTQGNAPSSVPALSANGRHVVFVSIASTLVAGDTNGATDVFVRDVTTNTVERLSVPAAGGQSDGPSDLPAISADGRYVAFESTATNLVPDDTNGTSDVFVRDRQAGTTERISFASDGRQGTGRYERASISGDGRYVAFTSTGGGALDPSMPTHAGGGAYVRDRQAATTRHIARAVDEPPGDQEPPNGPSGDAAISADGRYVAFWSQATNLTSGSGCLVACIHVYDVTSGTNTWVGQTSSGGAPDDDQRLPSVTTVLGAPVVSYVSAAANLVPGDTNGAADVFVRESGNTFRTSVASGGAQASAGSGLRAGGGRTISSDGRFVTFHSAASNLVLNDTNGLSDVFVHDRTLARTIRVSQQLLHGQADGNSLSPWLSEDGRYVAFQSNATNLVTKDSNSADDVFLKYARQVTVTGISQAAAPRGTNDVAITITGSGFEPGSRVEIPNADGSPTAAVTVQNVNVVSDSQITATLSVPLGSPLGPRNVRVRHAPTAIGTHRVASGECHQCFQVSPPPNVVLVLVDDLNQVVGPLWDALPQTRALIADRGLTFTNSFAVDPICCPARVSIMSGRYPHNTGIFTNEPPNGGFQLFTGAGESESIAVRLKAAGYTTGFAGKYLNGYESQPSHVPPGWDEWFGLTKSFYDGYTYEANHNGTIKTFGSSPADYQTDVLSGRAATFAQSTEVQDQKPFFLLLSPSAPHGPIPPAPRHVDNPFADDPLPPRANLDEADVSDKPLWLREGVDPLGATGISQLATVHQRMTGSLLAVDDMVASLAAKLAANGELDHTVLVFASDNGYNLGSHRLQEKMVPYEESVRVPLAIAGPGVRTGTETQFAAHIDLLPTMLDVAGMDVPAELDGRSLVPTFNGSPESWRADLLLQFNGTYGGWYPVHTLADVQARLNGSGVILYYPTFRAIRTTESLYVEWYGGTEHEYELYDLTADPHQLVNLVATLDGAQQYAALTRSLQARLDQLAACSGPTCRS